MVELKSNPTGFHLQTWQWIVLGIIALLLLACAFSAYALNNLLNTGGPAPTVTSTSSGHHLYSPLHGGYSMDYPSRYILGSTVGMQFIRALVRNNSFDALVLTADNPQGVFMLVFVPPSSAPSPPPGPPDCVASPSSPNDTAQWVQWGQSQGCLQTSPTKNDGSWPTPSSESKTYLLDGHCLGSQEYIATSTSLSDMTQILSTMRCGPDAVK